MEQRIVVVVRNTDNGRKTANNWCRQNNVRLAVVQRHVGIKDENNVDLIAYDATGDGIDLYALTLESWVEEWHLAISASVGRVSVGMGAEVNQRKRNATAINARYQSLHSVKQDRWADVTLFVFPSLSNDRIRELLSGVVLRRGGMRCPSAWFGIGRGIFSDSKGELCRTEGQFLRLCREYPDFERAYHLLGEGLATARREKSKDVGAWKQRLEIMEAWITSEIEKMDEEPEQPLPDSVDGVIAAEKAAERAAKDARKARLFARVWELDGARGHYFGA